MHISLEVANGFRKNKKQLILYIYIYSYSFKYVCLFDYLKHKLQLSFIKLINLSDFELNKHIIIIM